MSAVRAAYCAAALAAIVASEGVGAAPPVPDDCDKNHYILDGRCVPIVVPHGQLPSFKITQVYSNLDGSLQFVELTEMAGRDGQHRFAGLTLSVTHDRVTRTYTFPHDLPSEQTAHTSITVATSRLPVDTGVAWVCCYASTFVSLPARFLAVRGATIDFAGVDRVTYAALPTDGDNAWYRDASLKAATVRKGCPAIGFLGCGHQQLLTPLEWWIGAVEYHNASRDHYFVTALADEIEALDAGRVAGWSRTGQTFGVGGGSLWDDWVGQPVCRFYIPPDLGDSHFFSVLSQECDAIESLFPRLVLETRKAFFAARPNPVSGDCLNGGVPLYRLWNQRSDSNHRYTKSLQIRDEMITRGYLPEGFGPLGAAMCVAG